MSNEWLTTLQLRDRLCDPSQIRLYDPAHLYHLLKVWREGTPQLLVEGVHYKFAPYSEDDPTPRRVYSLRRICRLVYLHRFSNSVCKSIYPTDRFGEIVKTLDGNGKKR